MNVTQRATTALICAKKINNNDDNKNRVRFIFVVVIILDLLVTSDVVLCYYNGSTFWFVVGVFINRF